MTSPEGHGLDPDRSDAHYRRGIIPSAEPDEQWALICHHAGGRRRVHLRRARFDLEFFETFWLIVHNSTGPWNDWRPLPAMDRDQRESLGRMAKTGVIEVEDEQFRLVDSPAYEQGVAWLDDADELIYGVAP